MFKISPIGESVLRALESAPLLPEIPFLSPAAVQGDFRRQALKPSKWREYREREREKNRASMKAMGLSGNVFEWPAQHMPACMIAKLHRMGSGNVIDPEINRSYRDY